MGDFLFNVIDRNIVSVAVFEMFDL